MADSSPLIFLGQIQRLSVLEMFRPVSIPRQVLAEVEAGEEWDRATVATVRQAVRSGLVRVRDVRLPREFQPTLDLGERAALCLAVRQRGGVFLADEEAARSVAKALGIRCISTPFILLRAVEKRLLDARHTKEDLVRLIELGYHITPMLYSSVLGELAELDRKR